MNKSGLGNSCGYCYLKYELRVFGSKQCVVPTAWPETQSEHKWQNLIQLEIWIFPRDQPNMKNPSRSKSCHMQCSCHTIQVERTSQVMNMFPRIGGSPRIPSHHLRPSLSINLSLGNLSRLTFFGETYCSYRQSLFLVIHENPL